MTASKTPRESRRISLRLLIPVVVLVVIVVAWSVAWFVIRDEFARQVERGMQSAALQGIHMRCATRDITGFPLEFKLTCDGFNGRIRGIGGKLQVPHLKVTARTYNPRHLTIDADAPSFTFAVTPETQFIAGWRKFRASVHAGTAGLTDLDIKLDGGTLVDQAKSMSPIALSQGGNMHFLLSPDNADDLDVDVSLNALQTPSTPPVDLSLNARLAGHASLLRGEQQVLFPASGGVAHMDLKDLRVSSGQTAVSVSGPLTADPASRYVNGKLQLVVRDPAGLKPLLAPVFPPDSGVVEGLQAALGAFGKQTVLDGKPAYSTHVRLKKGVIRIGIIPVGAYPRLPQG